MSSSNINKKLKVVARKQLSIETYIQGIFSGDTNILGRAITLLESTKQEHEHIAQAIIEQCLPKSGKAMRIGISGVPGAGKSTFIEAFGQYLIHKKNKKVAVLAIDPSSNKSGGSILGDKTRMNLLSSNVNAFIRPSPSSGALGGVAKATRESIILCEAAGYDVILIETVGVGQSETQVHSMVDFFLLLMLAGAGDELQGIKRGIMEMADTLLINKADGDNLTKAKEAKKQYSQALHLFPPNENKWIPKVQLCSALHNEGIDEVWNTIENYYQQQSENGYLNKLRRSQAKQWMYESLRNGLVEQFYSNKKVNHRLKELEKKVENGDMNPYAASKELIALFLNSLGK